jgi:hypothetical protein
MTVMAFWSRNTPPDIEGMETVHVGACRPSRWMESRDEAHPHPRPIRRTTDHHQPDKPALCRGPAAITDPPRAFAAAHARYERMRADPQRAGWHACKRIFAFALMIHDGIAVAELDDYLTGSPWLIDHARHVFHTTPQASSGRWLLPELLHELPDLSLGVATVPTQGAHERQLAFLGPAGHRLGRHRQQLGDLRGQKVAGCLAALTLCSHRVSFPQPEPGQPGQGPEPDWLDHPVGICGGAGAWITLPVQHESPNYQDKPPAATIARLDCFSASAT